MAELRSRLRTVGLCATLIICAGNSALAVPLWEIDGINNRIWLLGSVHFLRAGDYPLPRAVTDSYRAADVIVMELVLDTIGPTDMQRVQQQLAIDPQGHGLSELVDARIWRKVQLLASAIDIDLDRLQPFEPWFAALQITQLRLLQLGFDGSYGIDATITRQARADSKPLLGLETLDEQLLALDTLPATAQQNFLLQTLEDAGSIGDDLDRIVTAWKQGDIKTLDNLLLEGLDGQPEVYEQLLVRRNRRWTKAIIGMTDDSRNYLIIVGTLHLIGKDSVQNMLGQAGLQTHQLR